MSCKIKKMREFNVLQLKIRPRADALEELLDLYDSLSPDQRAIFLTLFLKNHLDKLDVILNLLIGNIKLVNDLKKFRAWRGLE